MQSGETLTVHRPRYGVTMESGRTMALCRERQKLAAARLEVMVAAGMLSNPPTAEELQVLAATICSALHRLDNVLALAQTLDGVGDSAE